MPAATVQPPCRSCWASILPWCTICKAGKEQQGRPKDVGEGQEANPEAALQKTTQQYRNALCRVIWLLGLKPTPPNQCHLKVPLSFSLRWWLCSHLQAQVWHVATVQGFRMTTSSPRLYRSLMPWSTDTLRRYMGKIVADSSTAGHSDSGLSSYSRSWRDIAPPKPGPYRHLSICGAAVQLQ